VVVSDEVYKQSFCQNDSSFGQNGSLSDFHLETVYDILNVDMLELQKLGGDYPQNSSIDVLLKDFLESSTIMNLGQEFTLTFNCNAYLFKNYITFKVNGIVYKSDSDEFDDFDEFSELNDFSEIACSITHPYSDAVDIIAIKPYKKDANAIDVGLVANNEVKIKFLDEQKEMPLDKPFIDKMPLQKAKADVPDKNKDVPEIFKTKGLQLNLDSSSLSSPLSKEEIRRLRTKKFG
jgi:hypothetical protein